MYIIWHSRLYKPLYSHVAMHTFNTVCNKKKKKEKKKPWKGTWTSLQWKGALIKRKRKKKKRNKQEKTVDSLSGPKATMKHTVIQCDEVKMQAFYKLSVQILILKTVLSGVWNSAGWITSNLCEVKSF